MIRFTSRPGKILRGYRRGDTAGRAGRRYDDLVRVFGADSIFIKVDGLLTGDKFITVLRERLTELVAVLVAVGTRRAGERPDGTRRIDLTDDFVRLEVATALADRHTLVILVFLGRWTLAARRARTLRRGDTIRSDGWPHATRIVRASLLLGLLAVFVGAGAYLVHLWPVPSNAEPRLVETAAEQLARARREWVDDAVVSSISVECDSGRDGACPLRLRFSSTNRFPALDASRQAPDSSWSYRQRGGVSRTRTLTRNSRVQTHSGVGPCCGD